MKEIDSSVVRQCGRTEGYAEFARSSGNSVKPYLKGTV